jgi:hypothetical protein
MSLAALKWAAEPRAGSKSANHVLRVLADAANAYGTCFLSQKAIAERAQCSVSTVYRSLLQLEALGLLTRAQRRTARGYRSSDQFTLAMHTKPDAVQPVNLTAWNSRLPVKLTGPTGQIDGARVNQCSNHKREAAAEQQARSLSEQKLESLPDDWTLPTEWRRWTHIHFKATDDAITRSAARFHTYYRRPGWEAKIRDAGSWIAAWKMWCHRERDFIRRTIDQVPGADSHASLVREDQRRTVRAFVGMGFWPAIFGPRPDEPGCRIPPDILAEFGFGPVIGGPTVCRSPTGIARAAQLITATAAPRLFASAVGCWARTLNAESGSANYATPNVVPSSRERAGPGASRHAAQGANGRWPSGPRRLGNQLVE